MLEVTPSNSENKPGISKGAFSLTRSSFSVPNEVPEEISAGFLAIRRFLLVNCQSRGA